MKNPILLLLLLFCHYHNAWSQSITTTDLQVEQLRGPVKFLASERYNVSDSTGKEKRTWYFSQNELFNKAGNLIYKSNKNITPYFNDSTHYTYDSLQNLLTEEVIGAHNLLKKEL